VPAEHAEPARLIRHMTDVERWWFRRVLLAEERSGALFDDDEEWQVTADATIAEAIAAYWSEIEIIDRHSSPRAWTPAMWASLTASTRCDERSST